MSKQLTDAYWINNMVDPTGALQRAGLYRPLTEHTPGPFRYDETWGIVYGANDTEMAACHSNKADAAFIVRACNEFDALLAALEAMIDMATDGRTHGPEIDRACAAIAKATGNK